MPTSSLVLTLEASTEPREQALRFLGDDSRFTVGEPVREFLPVVLQTESIREGVDLIEALWKQCGVSFVDVVQIAFDDAIEPSRAGSSDVGQG